MSIIKHENVKVRIEGMLMGRYHRSVLEYISRNADNHGGTLSPRDTTLIGLIKNGMVYEISALGGLLVSEKGIRALKQIKMLREMGALR